MSEIITQRFRGFAAAVTNVQWMTTAYTKKTWIRKN